MLPLLQSNDSFADDSRSVTESEQPVETELTSGKSISLPDLGVTPQTVFISPRTVTAEGRGDLRRLKSQFPDPYGRRSSLASRSTRGAGESPLEEIRKRLASIEPPTPKSEKTMSEPHHERSGSDSAISSTIDLASVSLAGRKKGDSKAAPAVGASHTTAVGMTSLHDGLLSGRSTPVPGQLTPRATPYSSTYEGKDPGVRAFLEQVDLDTYRAPLLDFGPRVTASHRKRQARPKSSSPQNVTLIAHLTQHTGPIVSIVNSPDMVFFATASEDSQVLIWDSARLERSVSGKARLTYRMDSPITCMCRIENSHCLVVAGEDGQVHVLKVHVGSGSSPKYSRIECLRSWATDARDGHIVSVAHLKGKPLPTRPLKLKLMSDSLLLIVTSTSVIATLDIRSTEIVNRFQHPAELGVITATCHSVHWVVVGTDSGTLSLWDLRFGLRLQSWRANGPILSIQNHPSRGRGRWVMVSTARQAESPIVEVYDIESGKRTEMYEVRITRPTNKNLQPEDPALPLSKKDYIEEIIRRQEVLPEDGGPEIPYPSVTALAVGHAFASLSSRQEESGLVSVAEGKSMGNNTPGWMITAGEDRVIRYWDLAEISDGFVICGSPKEKEVHFRQLAGIAPALYYTLPASQKQSADQRHATLASGRQPLRPHYDVISALGTVETPFSSCVISGDRSGVIKVWRLEGGNSR